MKRPLIVAPVLALLLGSIFLLPKQGKIAESAIKMKLAKSLGNWELTPIPPSPKEIEILAKDTEFSKANCLLLRKNSNPFNTDGKPEADLAQLSIVLSGYDLNSSIHRPERCMPAQGHKIRESGSDTLTLESGRQLPVRRLLSTQSISPGNDPNKSVDANCLTYYFFVGHDNVLATHEDRVFTDMKDRLLKGQDQRWAYISVSMMFGDLPGYPAGTLPSKEETDEKIRDLLQKLAEQNIDWSQIAA